MAQFMEIVIDQGADYAQFITLTDDTTGNPINVATYTNWVSNVKSSYVTSNVAFNFTITVPDAANGNVGITVVGGVTSNIIPKDYVFDVKATTPGSVKIRLVQGLVTVNPQT